MVLQTGTAGHGVVIARSPELYPFSPYGKHHTCAKAVGFCSYGCFEQTKMNRSVDFLALDGRRLSSFTLLQYYLLAYGPEILFNLFVKSLLQRQGEFRRNAAGRQRTVYVAGGYRDAVQRPDGDRLIVKIVVGIHFACQQAAGSGGHVHCRAAGGSPLRCQAMYWKG